MLQRNGFALPFVILSLLYQQILSLSGDFLKSLPFPLHQEPVWHFGSGCNQHESRQSLIDPNRSSVTRVIEECITELEEIILQSLSLWVVVLHASLNADVLLRRDLHDVLCVKNRWLFYSVFLRRAAS